MKDYITFYKKVDEGMNGQVTGWLVFFVIPMIISIVLLNFDIFLADYILKKDIVVPLPIDLIWYKAILFSVINYIVLGVFVIIALLALALTYATGSGVWSWAVARFKGLQNLITVIKKAKTESFDNSNINLDPKKQEMNIKG